jgi:hypothetical protein
LGLGVSIKVSPEKVGTKGNSAEEAERKVNKKKGKGNPKESELVLSSVASKVKMQERVVVQQEDGLRRCLVKTRD